MKRLIIPAAIGLIAVATPLTPAFAVAQEDAEPANAETQVQDDDDIEDTIVIFGESGPRDEAMAAFARGDYETAELEFGYNLRCAKRVESMELSAYENARGAQVTTDAGSGGGASGAADLNTGRTQTGIDSARRPDAEDIAERSCDMPAYQLYMVAMSQIKQGKNVEAKENLYRVIRMSKDPRFFDAHYRLALLELLDGNVDEAEKQLDTLLVLQRRCQRQGDYCDYRQEIDEAVAFVEGALAEREQQAG